jgi:hypothetical protein
VLFVLGPPSKTATFLGEFSVVRWGFHAGTIPRRDVPFQNKFQRHLWNFSEPPGSRHKVSASRDGTFPDFVRKSDGLQRLR